MTREMADAGTVTAIPDGADLDGAVCELWRQDDGTWTAEIRIPAHQPE